MFMLLSQRPLTPSETDAGITIASRVELARRICRNARRRRNTLVLGARGSGRTSMLSLVERQLRSEPGTRVVRVDAEACRDTADLVAVLLAALGEDPRGPTTQTVTWRDSYLTSSTDDRVVTLPRPANETDAGRIADVARRLMPQGDVCIVLVDNLDPVAAHDLFGRFRDALWAAPLVWIGAGDGDRDGYLSPPADVFWESVEWLEPIDGDEVEELLTRRIEAAGPDDPDARIITENLDELVGMLQAPTPREAVRAAAEVAEHGSVRAAFGSTERFALAQQAGGRRAAMLLAEIEQLARPVHAGDEELLNRMGLTRPRLVQLMNALESAGLLQRHREGKRVVFEAKP